MGINIIIGIGVFLLIIAFIYYSVYGNMTPDEKKEDKIDLIKTYVGHYKHKTEEERLRMISDAISRIGQFKDYFDVGNYIKNKYGPLP